VRITPHIVVGDAAGAAEWYARALGAEEQRRLPLPNGKLVYVELRFGDSTVMVADEFPDHGVLSAHSIGGTPVVLHLLVENADAAWQRATDAGAEVVQPLADVFFGNRHGQIRDPFGHKWNISQHLRDVPQDEVARAAAEIFG
jgi:PhnB protein